MQAADAHRSAMNSGRVLVIERDRGRAEALDERLRWIDYEPVIADSTDSIAAFASATDVAAIVGGSLSEQSLRQGLAILSRARPGLPILWLADGRRPDAAAAALSGHPVWTLDWPMRRGELERLLKRAARYAGTERRHAITGDAPPVRRVRELIEKVADFDTSVLITGESGTGKELVARTIHDLSERAGRPLVPINCGAIPEDLLESELFGHRKGAFTGAVSDRVGRFALAEGGTLFLDEIGDMGLSMQVKLLRVLEERRFERVGCNEAQRADVRIVAATHRDLPAAVASGEFREDLYFRLNVFPIEMPCLRKRIGDLPALFGELLLRHQGQGEPRLRLSPEALQVLAGYEWPGNIRELSNLVERLAILKPDGEVGVADLPVRIREASRASVTPARSFHGADLKAFLRSVESDLIGQAMDLAGGTTAKAARLLGMQRTTLVEKLARLTA
jgi:sigma-54 specific flagellar transcriptional regulator A